MRKPEPRPQLVSQQIGQDVPDGHGGQTRQFMPMRNLWVWPTLISGKEELVAQSLANVQFWRLKTRYLHDINAGDRIVMGDVTLNIRSVEDLENRHRWIEMLCDTGTTGGE